MRPETAVCFADMDRAIDTILKIVSDEYTYSGLSQISLLALERAFEILGEAASRIKKLEICEFQAIPDGELIIGLRNMIVHGYDRIDSDRLVQIGRTDIVARREWGQSKLWEADLQGH